MDAEIPGVVEVKAGLGGLPTVVLMHSCGASAEVGLSCALGALPWTISTLFLLALVLELSCLLQVKKFLKSHGS